MPMDFRRFTGPEISTPYSAFVAGAGAAPPASLLDEGGKRADGRALDEPRPLFVKTGVVSQAKGSAYIECGNTKAICSVFAPREIPNRNEFSLLGQLYCEVKLAMFSCGARRAHAPDAEERALASVLRQALEPAVNRNRFPNYQVDVFVYILEHDGGCLAAAITAAGLALADAAVPMYDTIGAATLAVLGDQVLVDPTQAEEEACLAGGAGGGDHGVATLAVLPEIRQISDFTQIGSMDEECIMNTMQLLLEKCRGVCDAVRAALLRRVHRELDAAALRAGGERGREGALQRRVEEFRRKLVIS